MNRRLSLLAALFSLVGCTVQIVGGLFRLVPLIILGDDHFMNVFTLGQLQAIALLFIKLHAQVFSVSFVCFALFDLLIGYLILRSTFLPRVLGVVMVSAGVGALSFLWPPLAASLSPYIFLIGGLAELLLLLWLLVKGVDISKWQEQASARPVGRA